MKIRAAAFCLILGAGVLTTASAGAIVLPDFPPPPSPEPTATPSGVMPSERRLEEQIATPTPTPTLPPFEMHPYRVALNFDYVHTEQDFDSTLVGVGSYVATSKLDSYTGRLEYQPFDILSVYGIAGYHQGSSKVSTFEIDLDGWAAGVGTTAILPLPLPCLAGVICPTAFSAFDFNYTYNDYEEVKNGINIVNFTTRAGVITRVVPIAVGIGLWAGPTYQSVTRDQKIEFNGQTPTFRVRPKDRWNGIIGARLDWLSPRNRVPISLTVEGGVGNRSQILVSLRYEWPPRKREQ